MESTEIQPTDTIVEVGCGEGWFSYQLAKRCDTLHILELDPYFLNETQNRLNEFTHVSYHLGDALKTTFEPIPEPAFRIIANIPYQISAPFTKMIIANHARVIDATLLVQKEFGKKLVAKPGTSSYSSLAIYAQFYLDTTYLFDVSRNCFRPIPRVDSAVITLTPRKTPLFDVNPDLFFAITRTAFWGKRKPLISSLAKSPYVDLTLDFKSVPFFAQHPNIRGETMSTEMFYELYLQISPFWIMG